jgi:hypothetical protein
MKRLLLVSSTTGYQGRAFRQAAARLGLPLVLASDRCHQLEDPWEDGAIPIRFERPQESAAAIADFARAHPIGGVATIGDLPTLAAAHAAQTLGITFHSPRAVEISRNKFLSREHYRAAGLETPWFIRIPAATPPAAALESFQSQIRFPCVLKPLVLSASRGVIRANGREEFIAAFQRIRALLTAPDVRKLRDPEAEWILAEGFISGPEVAVEGLMTRGSLRMLAIFDKPDPLEGPYFEETIYVTPSRLPITQQQAIEQTVARACAAVGLEHGPIHAELRLHKGNPVMLEMAGRPIGGLCARALRFTSEARRQEAASNGIRGGSPAGEITLEELILRHASGEAVEGWQRQQKAAGVMMIPIPQAGIYEGVAGEESAARVPGVEAIEITAKLRQTLVPLPEGASYLGFIFARGDSPEFVANALRRAHGQLKFEVSAALKLV